MSPELLADVDDFAKDQWARAAALLSQAEAGNLRQNWRVRAELLKATAALSRLRIVSSAAVTRGATKLKAVNK